jgi:hypothetical protein
MHDLTGDFPDAGICSIFVFLLQLNNASNGLLIRIQLTFCQDYRKGIPHVKTPTQGNS